MFLLISLEMFISFTCLYPFLCHDSYVKFVSVLACVDKNIAKLSQFIGVALRLLK